MKIALYHPWVYLKGGIERTLLELTGRSRHDWTIFCNRFVPDDTFPEFLERRVIQLSPVSLKRGLLSVASACVRVLLQAPDLRGFDALVVSCDSIGNLITLRQANTPMISLCHTPLKVAYDSVTRERWRRYQKPSLITRAAVNAFATVDRRLWDRYQKVFAVSEEVASRLAAAGLTRNVEVLHPGVDASRLQPSGRRESFFLAPGRIMWTKNLELAINAFSEWKSMAGRTDARLVIAGMVDEKSRRHLAHLKHLASRTDGIEFIESPPDDELFDLYDRCHSVLFTAPNEDWGIVPLEAMAFGKPVIAVNRGGPAESILHGQTGLLVQPNSGAFAKAMRCVTEDEDLYSRMSAAARSRARAFDWGQFVDRIDSYLESLRSKAPIPATAEA